MLSKRKKILDYGVYTLIIFRTVLCIQYTNSLFFLLRFDAQGALLTRFDLSKKKKKKRGKKINNEKNSRKEEKVLERMEL